MRTWRLAAALVAVMAVGAGADEPLDTGTILVRDPVSGGELQIVSSVYDALPRLRYVYEVTNVSYDPSPGETNLFSGLEVSWGVLPGPLEAEDGIAPAGWTIDLHLEQNEGVFVCAFTRAWADGSGIGIGETATFGYTSVGWYRYGRPDPVFPDFGFTHSASGPEGWFLLVDSTDGGGLIQPIPGAATLGVLGAGGLVLGRRRRR